MDYDGGLLVKMVVGIAVTMIAYFDRFCSENAYRFSLQIVTLLMIQ